MIGVNEIKTGMTIIFEGALYQIIEFQHVKPGKGAAFLRTKMKNLRTGSTIENTFNTSAKVELARVEKRDMQFLYEQSGVYNFMNLETYEQLEMDKNSLGDEVKYLKENLIVTISSYDGEILGLILPDKIEMKIVQSDPAIKGNTSQGAMKDAELETGMTIKVPLFIEEGETVIVSTSDGKYVSRA